MGLIGAFPLTHQADIYLHLNVISPHMTRHGTPSGRQNKNIKSYLTEEMKGLFLIYGLGCHLISIRKQA
jgi:hypothetical protein